MGDCVTSIIVRFGDEIAEGDMFATNAPYNGGTHLPDITVVAPVFIDGQRKFFTAARGHHAELGDISRLDAAFFLHHRRRRRAVRQCADHRAGHFDEDTVRAILDAGDYPARNPGQNIADLKAQAAACARETSNSAALWACTVRIRSRPICATCRTMRRKPYAA